MKTEKTLKIATIIGEDIRTRSRIHELRRHISAGTEYQLDFTNVRFISRSFADELLSLVEESEARISFYNTTTEITKMLEIVKTNRNRPPEEGKKGKVRRLDNMEQVLAFFSAL